LQELKFSCFPSRLLCGLDFFVSGHHPEWTGELSEGRGTASCEMGCGERLCPWEEWDGGKDPALPGGH